MQNLIWVLIGTSTTGLHTEKEKQIKLVNRIKITKEGHYSIIIQGVFFNWYPPKKLKYGKPRLGVSRLT